LVMLVHWKNLHVMECQLDELWVVFQKWRWQPLCA
jgi:hypothetical protein